MIANNFLNSKILWRIFILFSIVFSYRILSGQEINDSLQYHRKISLRAGIGFPELYNIGIQVHLKNRLSLGIAKNLSMTIGSSEKEINIDGGHGFSSNLCYYFDKNGIRNFLRANTICLEYSRIYLESIFIGDYADRFSLLISHDRIDKEGVGISGSLGLYADFVDDDLIKIYFMLKFSIKFDI
jgi:hypothetical protein